MIQIKKLSNVAPNDKGIDVINNANPMGKKRKPSIQSSTFGLHLEGPVINR